MSKVLTIPLIGGWKVQGYQSNLPDGRAVRLKNFECIPGGGYKRSFGTTTHPAGEVPGNGPIWGAFFYQGKIHAVRENGADTVIYSATPTDNTWTVVHTYSGITGTKETWDFAFGDIDGSPMIYGANGLTKGFRYDGSTWTEITTPEIPDVPNRVALFRKRIWWSHENVVTPSNYGDSTSYQPANRATEFALKENVTGMMAWREGRMAVFTDAAITFVNGGGTDDTAPYEGIFELNPVTGGYPSTFQQVDNEIYFVDDSKLMRLRPAPDGKSGIVEHMSSAIDPGMREVNWTAGQLITGSWVDAATNTYKVMAGQHGASLAMSGNECHGFGAIEFLKEISCTNARYTDMEAQYQYAGTSDGYMLRLDVIGSNTTLGPAGEVGLPAEMNILIPSVTANGDLVEVTRVVIDVKVFPSVQASTPPTITLKGMGDPVEMTWSSTPITLPDIHVGLADNVYVTRASANVMVSGTKFMLTFESEGGEMYAVGAVTLDYEIKGPRPNA